MAVGTDPKLPLLPERTGAGEEGIWYWQQYRTMPCVLRIAREPWRWWERESERHSTVDAETVRFWWLVDPGKIFRWSFYKDGKTQHERFLALSEGAP